MAWYDRTETLSRMWFNGYYKVELVPMLDYVQIVNFEYSSQNFKRGINEYADLLNTPLEEDLLVNYLKFTSLDVRGGSPRFQYGNYEITNDKYGYYLDPYDSMNGRRIHTINDLTNLGLYLHL